MRKQTFIRYLYSDTEFEDFCVADGGIDGRYYSEYVVDYFEND